MSLEELLEKHTAYEKSPDRELIRRAYGFAEVAHLGQKRLSGEPHLQHSLAVAEILTEVHADSVTLAAALLHDILEESDLSREELAKEFGEEVTALVEGLTAVKGASAKAGEKVELENLRHLMLATVRDPRVLLIRLAEKIHNLMTAEALPEEKRRASAHKALDLWSPLASLLGLYRFKTQLEDLAFSILEPEKYKELEQKVRAEAEKMEGAVEEVKEELRRQLQEAGVPAEVSNRTKHLYGVFRKLPRYEGKGGKFFDVLGLRIITEKVEDCYRSLDLARKIGKEVPDLFDDYIARPKPNGYQSLHAVFEVGEYLIEIQIRTRQMHAVAEYGLAAHPLYREKQAPAEEKISLIKSLVLWEKGQELNLFPDQVFVFTPKGDVKVLPKGSTPVDFAYSIHTQIGNECTGARVSGKMVPLSYPLRTGEVVEIRVSKGRKPSADWLKFVQTEEARNAIAKHLRR